MTCAVTWHFHEEMPKIPSRYTWNNIRSDEESFFGLSKNCRGRSNCKDSSGAMQPRVTVVRLQKGEKLPHVTVAWIQKGGRGARDVSRGKYKRDNYIRHTGVDL